MLKKWCTRLLIAVVLFGFGSLAVPDIVPQTETQTVVQAKTLTKKQAKKKLVKWLKKKGLYNKSYRLAYEGMEGKKYTFQYYQDMGTHTATINWYYVHKSTGKITSMF